MADVKTKLRELSVIVGLMKAVNKTSYLGTPKSFISICKTALPNITDHQYLTIQELNFFNAEQSQIIENGFNLASVISNKFDIHTISEINWYGFDTQKEEPYDISVNGFNFSLKEDSFILENMGLYKLLNCYTGSCYKKRHIFNDYAPNEYASWFDVTWRELLTTLEFSNNQWTYINTQKKKESIIAKRNDTITLSFYLDNRMVAQSILPLNCSLSCYEKSTSSKTREEVFAKFINMVLDNNANYNNSKRTCAIVASKALAKELNDNLNYKSGLPRFLRIHDSEYYYAKTTSSKIELFRVPALMDFENNIKIESIVASVPDKQANILTTIRNLKTGEKLVLRNECRFSHGQFNGTPEAKMYYENGGSLLTIYESI